MNVKKHLGLLGLRAEDKITGFKGVVSSLWFDLYGCIQACITPPVSPDGKKGDPIAIDVSRLKILDEAPVMGRPNWDFGPVAEGAHGPAEKPVSEGTQAAIDHERNNPSYYK